MTLVAGPRIQGVNPSEHRGVSFAGRAWEHIAQSRVVRGIGTYGIYAAAPAALAGISLAPFFTHAEADISENPDSPKHLSVRLDPGDYTTFRLSTGATYNVYAYSDKNAVSVQASSKDKATDHKIEMLFGSLYSPETPPTTSPKELQKLTTFEHKLQPAIAEARSEYWSRAALSAGMLELSAMAIGGLLSGAGRNMNHRKIQRGVLAVGLTLSTFGYIGGPLSSNYVVEHGNSNFVNTNNAPYAFSEVLTGNGTSSPTP